MTTVEEIKKDKQDTENEILYFKSKLWSFWGRFDQTYQKEISEREEFILRLNHLLKQYEN